MEGLQTGHAAGSGIGIQLQAVVITLQLLKSQIGGHSLCREGTDGCHGQDHAQGKAKRQQFSQFHALPSFFFISTSTAPMAAMLHTAITTGSTRLASSPVSAALFSSRAAMAAFRAAVAASTSS